jgi:hypothetical protein
MKPETAMEDDMSDDADDFDRPDRSESGGLSTLYFCGLVDPTDPNRDLKLVKVGIT